MQIHNSPLVLWYVWVQTGFGWCLEDTTLLPNPLTNNLLISKEKSINELLKQKEQVKLLVDTPAEWKSLVETSTYTEIPKIFGSSRSGFSFSMEFQCLVAFRKKLQSRHMNAEAILLRISNVFSVFAAPCNL